MWNDVCLRIGDALLGWTLALGTDVAIIVLALVTTALMLIVRVLTTNQDLLRRVALDRRRLKEKMAEAKRVGDKEARARYRLTFNQLGIKKLGAEVKPLLLVLLPVAILATWALYRLEFHPPQRNEQVTVTAYFPVSYLGEVVHLTPFSEGRQQEADRWVQPVTSRPNEPGWWDRLLRRVGLQDDKPLPSDIAATWALIPSADAMLAVRTREGTLEHPLWVGRTIYAEPVKEHDGGAVTQVHMREVKLFGIVPGLGGMFPGWLVGYLALVLPLVPIAKKVFGIY